MAASPGPTGDDCCFRIERMEERPSIALIRCDPGALDDEQPAEITALYRDLDASGCTRVLWDLEHIDIFTSCAIAVLLSTRNRVYRIATGDEHAERGGSEGPVMAIVSGDERVSEVIRLTRLDTLMPVFRTRGRAIEALNW